MEVISLWHCWGGIEAQVSLTVAFSSSALLGLVSLIFLLTIPHRFSMEFRSGVFAGHSSTVTPWSLNQLLVPLAVWCDESAASSLIISTPRPLIAALHQAPDGSGCVREEGRCNSQVWRRVMRHTPEVNGASSPPLLYAGCASPLETGLFPVHARWCPRGSRKGALRDRVPPKARAAGPAVRTRTATRETAVGPGCRAD